MSEQQKPSVFWSVVGVGLPAATTVIALVAMLTTERGAAWMGLAVVFGVSTLLAIQRVYSAFSKP